MQIVIHWAAGLYGPVWRYASIEEAVRVMAAVAAGTLAAFGWLWLLDDITTLTLPLLTAPPVAALLILIGCGGVRFQSRLFALERQRTRAAKSVRALIVGAGSPGAALAYELSHTDSGRDVHVVGFVDDDVRLHGRSRARHPRARRHGRPRGAVPPAHGSTGSSSPYPTPAGSRRSRSSTAPFAPRPR